MDTAEITDPAQVGTQALVKLLHNLVRIPLELFRAIIGQFSDRGLRRIPIARTIMVEIGGGTDEPTQRVSKDCGRFTWHHATELNSAIPDPAMGSRGRRRRSKVDGAGHLDAYA
jgi:hypothetical protein